MRGSVPYGPLSGPERSRWRQRVGAKSDLWRVRGSAVDATVDVDREKRREKERAPLDAAPPEVVTERSSEAEVVTERAPGPEEPVVDSHASLRARWCPVSRAIRMLEKKWTIHIIYELAAGTRRFCHLQERIGNANARTLSERLKELEEEGLVRRDVINTIPPWVEYSLTAKGDELCQLVEGVAQWARKWSLFGEVCAIRPCGECDPD